MASTVYLFLQIILLSEKNNRRIVLFAAVAVFLPLAVILFLPMTFSLEVTKGISLLVGLYMGGISGGLISGSSSRYPTR